MVQQSEGDDDESSHNIEAKGREHSTSAVATAWFSSAWSGSERSTAHAHCPLHPSRERGVVVRPPRVVNELHPRRLLDLLFPRIEEGGGEMPLRLARDDVEVVHLHGGGIPAHAEPPQQSPPRSRTAVALARHDGDRTRGDDALGAGAATRARESAARQRGGKAATATVRQGSPARQRRHSSPTNIMNTVHGATQKAAQHETRRVAGNTRRDCDGVCGTMARNRCRATIGGGGGQPSQQCSKALRDCDAIHGAGGGSSG